MFAYVFNCLKKTLVTLFSSLRCTLDRIKIKESKSFLYFISLSTLKKNYFLTFVSGFMHVCEGVKFLIIHYYKIKQCLFTVIYLYIYIYI